MDSPVRRWNGDGGGSGVPGSDCLADRATVADAVAAAAAHRVTAVTNLVV